MGSGMRAAALRWLVRLSPLAWMAVIFAFSSVQSPRLVDEPLADLALKKVGHFVGYAGLALLLAAAVSTTRWTSRAVTLGFAAAVLFALSDEFHQVFTPTRWPSLIDVAIDAAGAYVGVRSFEWWRRRGDSPGQRPRLASDQNIDSVSAE